MSTVVKEIEVQADLWDAFEKAASQNQMSTDEVLTDFMREYVEKTEEEQRQIRKEALEYANASMRLEGFELSEKDQELGKLYIEGKIDSDGLRSDHESLDEKSTDGG